jgi:hypothetical protein
MPDGQARDSTGGSGMFWPFGILAIALPIFAVVLLVGALVLAARGHRSEGLNFSVAILLAAALVTATVGFAWLLSPIFSSVLGRDFTYSTRIPPLLPAPPPPPGVPGPPPSPVLRETEQAQLTSRVENQYRDDLVYGATMLLVGLIVFGLLVLGRWFLQRRDAESDLLSETYLVLMLITTTVVALAALIAAIAQLLRRYVVVPVGPDRMLPHPGAALASAIAFTPLWGWFLVRAIQRAASGSRSTG